MINTLQWKTSRLLFISYHRSPELAECSMCRPLKGGSAQTCDTRTSTERLWWRGESAPA